MYSCYTRDYSIKCVNCKVKQKVDRTTRCVDIAIRRRSVVNIHKYINLIILLFATLGT